MSPAAERRFDRVFDIALVAYVVFLIVFGAVSHPIPHDAYESDPYLLYARELREGQIPVDRFRGLLYPAAVAATSFVVGEVLPAARICSSIALGVILFCVQRIGDRTLGRPSGVLAAIAIATNPHAILCGIVAMTDAFTTAWLWLAMLFAIGLRAANPPRVRTAIGLGVACGLAWSTRYTALVFVPTVALALLMCARTHGARTATKMCGVTALACLIAATPQLLLNAHLFGNPVYNENWRTLLVKLDGKLDFSLLRRDVAFDGTWSVIRAYPEEFIDGAIRELRALVYRSVSVFGGGAFGHVTRGAVVIAALLLIAPRRWTRLRAVQPHQATWLLLTFAASHALLVGVMFLAWPRVIFPIVPACVLVAMHLVFAKLIPRLTPAKPVRIAVTAVIFGLLWAGVASRSWHMLADFAATHPHQEFAALSALVDSEGRDVAVISTRPATGASLGLHCVADTAADSLAEGTEAYFSALRRACIEENVSFVVFGRDAATDRPAAMLRGEDLPPFLRLHRAESAYVVFRVEHTR